MPVVTQELVVQILTEDGSQSGPDVIFHLFTRIVRYVEHTAQTQHIRRSEVSSEVRSSMRGNAWKGDGYLRTKLIRSVATRLSTGECVAIHIDGDSLSASESVNLEQFNRLIYEPLRVIGGSSPVLDLGRLLLFMPCYSIESWCYLNRGYLEVLSQTSNQVRTALTELDNLFSKETGFDHVWMIKDECTLGSTINLKLASNQFPVDDVFDVSPSFQSLVFQFVESDSMSILISNIKAAQFWK